MEKAGLEGWDFGKINKPGTSSSSDAIFVDFGWLMGLSAEINRWLTTDEKLGK